MSKLLVIGDPTSQGSEFKQLRDELVPTCVVVLNEIPSADQLSTMIREATMPISKCLVVQPHSTNIKARPTTEGADKANSENFLSDFNPIGIEAVKLLNPKFSRQQRQKNMAIWLIPFGFLSGLTFVQMTGLTTFSKLGMGPLGETLLGGLLGMGSGWIGSYVAAGSVSPDSNDYVNTLRKLNEQGKWLLLLETPTDSELPWQFIKDVNPVEVVRVSDL